MLVIGRLLMVVVMTSAAGCNLVFTSQPDGAPSVPDAASHDEDGDGLDDKLDNCPFFPNLDQADVDSDQVGDVCDTLNPFMPPQADRMVRFLPLTGVLSSTWPDPFEYGDDVFVPGNDSIDVEPNQLGKLQFQLGLGTATLWVAFEVTRVPTGTTNIGIHGVSPGSPEVVYYANIFRNTTNGNVHTFNVGATAGGGPPANAELPLLQPGDRGIMQVSLSKETGQVGGTLTLFNANGRQNFVLVGAQANYAGASVVRVYVEGFGLKITSVAVVAKK